VSKNVVNELWISMIYQYQYNIYNIIFFLSDKLANMYLLSEIFFVVEINILKYLIKNPQG